MAMPKLRIIGYNYALVHAAVHVVLAAALYFAVQPSLTLDMGKAAAVALGTAVLDFDHVPLWMDVGIRGYLKLRTVEEYGKPRKYKMHNFMVFFVALGGSLLVAISEYFLVGLFFAAMVLHIVWDLAEDVVVFKMGYRHWI
ncbi:MAG: hypothetical protein ABIA12_00455 [Candidatus Aenigmatarchaeota archaeon]